MIENKVQPEHWADIFAGKILRERPNKEQYVCASGITPSGVVHIGNFREIISVDLVCRALEDRGQKVRFIYSWDDYDVFRKVPELMPEQELLSSYLRQPITRVPDIIGSEQSYAAHNEAALEKLLPLVGISPEFIYQAQRYQKAAYAPGIRRALEKKDIIRQQLNQFRREDLAADWQPVAVFCPSCYKDTTKVHSWDGAWELDYSCSSCGASGSLDLRKTAAVKLPWRIDWAMRWSIEKVDFEPAGKDHHSEGGSFDTAKLTSQEVYDFPAPMTFQYDFIRIKGLGGKISSSGGALVSLAQVLEVYIPEILRYMFTSTRPNSEFAISFDLDVLKVYDDYERCEAEYYSPQKEGKARKKQLKQRRIYELSQVGRDINATPPYSISLRHLCNLLQIRAGDIAAVLDSLEQLQEAQRARLYTKAKCAWNWIQNYAPQDFRFSLRPINSDPIKIEPRFNSALNELILLVEHEKKNLSEKDFGILFYDLLRKFGLESKEFFPIIYQLLIKKNQGPRLVPFLYIINNDNILFLLKNYIN